MAEFTFVLSDLSPLEVFGVNNLRLHKIENEFPDIKFIARGDELKVNGEEAKIEKLKAILDALFSKIRKRGNISENEFSELLFPVIQRAEQQAIDTSYDEVIVHGSGGKIIRPRTKGQAQIANAVLKNDIVFATGPAGTGKTYLAVAMAVKALKEKQVKKIVLSRPAVEAGESLGFLPGDMKEKVDPYLRPLLDALADMIHSEKLKYYLQDNIIEIVPLAYMRGRTLNNAFVILDEAQNATEIQLKMFLTRMGEYSRVVITGDQSQVDLPYRQKSGLIQCMDILQNIKGIAFVKLQESDVVRHPLVRKIITAYGKLDAAKKNKK